MWESALPEFVPFCSSTRKSVGSRAQRSLSKVSTPGSVTRSGPVVISRPIKPALSNASTSLSGRLTQPAKAEPDGLCAGNPDSTLSESLSKDESTNVYTYQSNSCNTINGTLSVSTASNHGRACRRATMFHATGRNAFGERVNSRRDAPMPRARSARADRASYRRRSMRRHRACFATGRLEHGCRCWSARRRPACVPQLLQG